MSNELLTTASSLKRRRQKREGKLNNAEKRLFLPAKDCSSGEDEDCEESATDNMSVDEEIGNPDDSQDIIEETTPSDNYNVNEAECETELVYSTLEETVPSSSHNPTHEYTVRGDDSKKETALTKDGHGQEVGKVLEKQISTCYVSVDRLPEIQVPIYVRSVLY